MRKLLTVAIPCYNSQEYMTKAIESLLHEKQDIEILIIDDGSVDDTAAIADAYAKAYPDVIRSLHQKNGGHGEAVNCGIRYAKGLYYKVLDSDDWVDRRALSKVINALHLLEKKRQTIDMLIVNYVYEKVSENKRKVIRYGNALPKKCIFTWKDIGHFYPSQNLLMHSVIYRTQLLKKAHTELPKHTFYVDNLFVFQPLPYVEKMMYLDVDLYRYFIGREGQSVQEETMIRRIDQQLLVNRMMIDCMKEEYRADKKRYAYMVKYLTMILVISTIFLIRAGSSEHMEKKEALWKYLKNEKPWLYASVNKTLLGRLIQRKSAPGRKLLSLLYDISQRMFGFN